MEFSSQMKQSDSSKHPDKFRHSARLDLWHGGFSARRSILVDSSSALRYSVPSPESSTIVVVDSFCLLRPGFVLFRAQILEGDGFSGACHILRPPAFGVCSSARGTVELRNPTLSSTSPRVDKICRSGSRGPICHTALGTSLRDKHLQRSNRSSKNKRVSR